MRIIGAAPSSRGDASGVRQKSRAGNDSGLALQKKNRRAASDSLGQIISAVLRCTPHVETQLDLISLKDVLDVVPND